MLCHNGGMPSTLDNPVEHILYVAICRRRSLDDFSTVRITERCSSLFSTQIIDETNWNVLFTPSFWRCLSHDATCCRLDEPTPITIPNYIHINKQKKNGLQINLSIYHPAVLPAKFFLIHFLSCAIYTHWALILYMKLKNNLKQQWLFCYVLSHCWSVECSVWI